MAQEVINVGATPNDGQGDPIRTAFVKTNTNFGELYSRAQSSPPATLVGATGDAAGMYAYDSTNFYYCFADYDGSSIIWNSTADGNISQLSNGTSNISVESSGNVRVGAGGTNNALVVGATSSSFAGNILPSLTAAYSVGTLSRPWLDVWAAGNVNATYFVGDGSQLTGISTSGNSISSGSSLVEVIAPGGNILTTVNSVNITAVNSSGLDVTGTIISSGNITGGNLNTAGDIVSAGNVLAANLNAVYNVTATNVDSSTITAGSLSVLGNTGIGGNINLIGSAYASGNLNGTNITATGNVTGGNITTSGVVDSTGNIRSSNSIIAQGTVEATGDIITSGYFIGTFMGNVTGNFVVPGSDTQVIFNTSGNADAVGGFTYNKNSNTLAVLGNVNSQNINVSSEILATGNITSQGYFFGNGSQLTGIITSVSNITNGTSSVNIPSTNSNVTVSVNGNANVVVVSSSGANITGTLNVTGNANVGNLGATNIVGTLATAAQPNITSVGTLSALTVTGNVTSGNVSGTTGTFTNLIGTLAATSQNNITSVGTLTSLTVSGNIGAGNVSGTNITGTLATAAQPNITSVGTLSSLTVTGNVDAGNVSGTKGTFTTVVGTLTTGSQPNLTQIGILNSLSVSGNANTGPLSVTGNSTIDGNLVISGNINVTGNLNYNNVTDLVVGDPLIYVGANNHANVYDLGTVVAWDDTVYQHGGLVRDASDGIWKLFGNVVQEPTTTVDFTDAIYQPLQAGIITTTGLVNSNANGVGNIGSATGYFNTVFAMATSAQYADLAEVYIADADYEPGTVLSFDGAEEVTIATQDADPAIAGVVSTNPAYVMNSGVEGQHTAVVALVGQVPCKVQGNIRKGQMLVSAGNGHARAELKPEMGTVIGKALENFSGDQGVIKVVVGRL